MNINELFEMGPIGSKLELSATVSAFPPFQRVLLNRSDVEMAKNEITYILWKNHWMAPYKVVAENRRDAQIKQDIFGDPNYEISEAAKIAEQEYINTYQKTDELIGLDVSRRMFHWINNQMELIMAGEIEYDLKKASDLMKDQAIRGKALDAAIELAKKKTEESYRVRGVS